MQPNHISTPSPVAAAVTAITSGEAALAATEDEEVADRAADLVSTGYAKLAAAPAADLGEVVSKLRMLRWAMIEDQDKTIGGRTDLNILDSALADLERMRRGGLMAQIAARVAELVPEAQEEPNSAAGSELWTLVDAATFGRPRSVDELAFAVSIAASRLDLVSDRTEEAYWNGMRMMAAIIDGLRGLGAEIDPRIRQFFPPDAENRGKPSADHRAAEGRA